MSRRKKEPSRLPTPESQLTTQEATNLELQFINQGQLTHIGNLEATIAEQRKLLQRWYDDIHMNKDHSLWDDTEALLGKK